MPDLLYLASRLVLQLKRPDPERIHYINFAVTYMCNSRCKHCNIWKRYGLSNEVHNELTLEEIQNIFDGSRYLKNLRGIGLTGGEPFLRKDFVDLCGFFIQKYPKAGITIPTNSIDVKLITDKLKQIESKFNPKNIYISISLDGIGKTHDEIRGVPGNYEKVLRLIRVIREQVPSIKIGVSFTIMPENYKHILKVYELSRKLNIGFCCQFAGISENYYGNIEMNFKWDGVKLKEIEDDLIIITRKYCSRKSIFKKLVDVTPCYFLNMVDFQRNPRRKFKCYSGTHSLFLDPYGNVYPCIMLNQRLGNIRERNFDEIWFSRRARIIREYIVSGMCACWTPCETFPSLARDYKVMLFNLINLRRMMG